MAFHDLELKKIENTLNAFIEKIRPAAHIRPESVSFCKGDLRQKTCLYVSLPSKRFIKP